MRTLTHEESLSLNPTPLELHDMSTMTSGGDTGHEGTQSCRVWGLGLGAAFLLDLGLRTGLVYGLPEVRLPQKGALG